MRKKRKKQCGFSDCLVLWSKVNVWFLGGDNNNNVRKRSVEGDVKQRFTSLDFQQSEKNKQKR